jgi:hypothetical protein
MRQGGLIRTSVFVGRDQLEDLRQRSNESGIPMAFMIRRGISLYLSGISDQSMPRQGPRAERSELDQPEFEASDPLIPSTTP